MPHPLRTPLGTGPAAVVLTGLLVLLLTGCDGGSQVGSVQEPASGVASGSVAASPGAQAPTLASPPPGTPTGSLPDLVGRGLQYAQDTAQAAGFRQLSSHDALGRGRHQLFDRDWKVCFQTPSAGRHPESADVDLGAVKVGETCPRTDEGAAPVHAAGAVMPDLRGQSLSVAVDLLGKGASVTWRDAGSGHRIVLVPSNWQVCTQKPAAGAAYRGVPVTLTAVKFGERC